MTSSIYKKSVVLLLIIHSIASVVHAQVQIGIKGGLNFSELLTSGSPATNVNGTSQNLRYFPMTSAHGGVFFSIPLAKKWSFQPELVYSMQGATGKPEINYLVSATEEYKFGYLNIPLLIKYKLPVGFFVETGPQLGLLLSAKTDETLVGTTSDINYNVKSRLKSTEISWTLGAGYCSPFNVGFDVRYNRGLSSITQPTAEGQVNAAPITSGTMKSSVIQLGVFYIFGKKLFNPPSASE